MFGILTSLIAAAFMILSVQEPVHLVVAAGSLDRQDTIVTFRLPDGLEPGTYDLRDDSGGVTPLQIDAAGQAWFVLPELKAGTTRRYRLERSSAPPAAAVRLARQGDRLVISAGDRTVLAYRMQPGNLPREDIRPIFRRGGYIHPVHTPSGRIVTDDFPPSHPHQHGIWFAWTKTEYEGRQPDFWNMGDGTARVEFASLQESWSGPVHAGFTARHRHVVLSGPEAKTALNETWEVRVYRGSSGPTPRFVFDLVSTQECAVESPLVLPEYRYGGMGFRGHRDWDGAENCYFLTSEGKDRSNGHATRARWCHIGGMVDGQLAGIGILSHPGNFRSPQPMRIHPENPFFNFAPSQLGRWEISPGRAYVSRYRYVVSDGPPDADALNRLWDDWADPPQVTISRD